MENSVKTNSVEELIHQRKTLYLRLTQPQQPTDKVYIKDQLLRLDRQIMAKEEAGQYTYDEF